MCPVDEDAPCCGDVVEALKADPEGLGPWFAIAAATEKATETGDTMDGLA